MAILTGNEQLYLLGQTSTGAPAATTFPVRSSHVAGAGTRVITTTTSFVSTTTLAAVAGLSVSLVAGGTYSIEAGLPITTGSSGGVKLSVDTSDTLTAASMALVGKFFTTAGLATTTTTTFAAAVGSTATVVLAELIGALVVNTSGTLVLKAAQNASDGTTTSILPNGFLRVNKVS